MKKIDLSKNNPFSTYKSDFASNFTFGVDFDTWVYDVMKPALRGSRPFNAKLRFADIGAGPCYWASLFLSREDQIEIVAVDPSDELINDQALLSCERFPGSKGRLERRCQSVQEFSVQCADPSNTEAFDCIYFMQSAHYVGHDEFKTTFQALASALRTNGRIAIQARNMTPDWYPWAFPNAWIPSVESALRATDMFNRADRYVSAFSEMESTFTKVEIYEKSFHVSIPIDSYLQRLEDRWISTFMSEDIIDADLHRSGIDEMKAEYKRDTRKQVEWTEKYAVVVAHV